MRLIYADKLKQYINDCKHCEVCERREFGCDKECELPDFLTSIWEEVIDQQPTAYDVDNVVEELERAPYFHGECGHIETDEAIEIVKRGGIG